MSDSKATSYKLDSLIFIWTTMSNQDSAADTAPSHEYLPQHHNVFTSWYLSMGFPTFTDRNSFTFMSMLKSYISQRNTKWELTL
jgi:hypothetical protein